MYCYYGDSWTSGTTIVNSVTFGKSASPTAIHMILGSNYIMFVMTSSNGYYNSVFTIFGKLTNGDKVALSLVGSTNNASMPYNLTNDITKGVGLKFVSFTTGFRGAANKVYKFPVIFIDITTNLIVTNGDGTPATIDGLYISSYVTDTSTIKVGGSYVITSALLFSNNVGSSEAQLKTGLIAEW